MSHRRPVLPNQYRPQKIGDDLTPTPMTAEEQKSSWDTAFMIGKIVFWFILSAGIILAVVFSGIAAFRSLSCGTSSTPIVGSNGDGITGIDIQNTVNEVINSLTEINTCKSICANGCFKKFYSCTTEDNPSECVRRSLILKDCDNFINCLGECGLAFDHCATSMEEISDFSGSCVNKYNREIICPKN